MKIKTANHLLIAMSLLLGVVSCEDTDEPDGSSTPTSDGGTSATSDDTGWTETERMEVCQAADDAGWADAFGVISGCECSADAVYATWSMETYATVMEQRCYVGGWYNVFSQYCQESCDPDDDELKECCDAMLAWAIEQRPD